MFQNSEWLGRDGNDDVIVLLSARNKNWGIITALDIIKQSSGSGVSGIIMTKWSFVKSSEFEIHSGFHRFTLGFDFETMNITVYMDAVYVCVVMLLAASQGVMLIYLSVDIMQERIFYQREVVSFI